MKPFLIDSHCHLHFPAYDADRADVLRRMREATIGALTIGTSLATSTRGIAFAEQETGVWCTAGLHPEHLTSSFVDPNEGDVGARSVTAAELVALARTSTKVVAIGETGLDWHRVDEGPELEEGKRKQEQAFREHLAAARETGLPLVIHCRDALTRLAEILQTERTSGWEPRGVVHSFTGTWEEAQPLLDLGMSIAVNGIATFPPKKDADPSRSIDRTIRRVPLDRLLLETDAPYLAPAPYRGKRNEPTFVLEVAKYVADARGVPLEEVAAQTTENTVKLFRLQV